MKRLIPCRYRLRGVPWAIFCALAFTGGTGAGVFAQHAGGQIGVAGHVSAPPASHPVISHPVSSHPATPIRPPLGGLGTHSFVPRPPVFQILPPTGFRTGYPFRPIRPRRPIFLINPVPIFPPPGFGPIGFPFFGVGFGWGFHSAYWPNCGPFLSWYYECSGFLPAYYYGFGSTAYPSGPENWQPQLEIQNQPIYFYGEENSQYVKLFLKDGTVYNVTDYWLVNGELHFKILTENGAKLVEQVIDFVQLDLQKTIDVNTARGFRFVLRNEPLEQYLIDHPFSDAPNEGSAKPESAGPQ